mgnify:CR=1 FL=1
MRDLTTSKVTEMYGSPFKQENGEATISHKEADDKLKSYFREILPEYDEDRVYTSDIKKIFNWYNILQPKGYVTLDALNTEVKEETAE